MSRSRRARASRPATAAGTRLTLEIEELVAGGHGLARHPDAGVVLVPRTTPGDVVEAEVDTASRPPRGRVLRVVTAGRDRVEAPCPYFERCGGCDWMHLSSASQVRAHEAIVRAALVRALGAERVPAVVVHPAVSELGYRERARLAVRARRGRSSIGFRAASSHDLVEIDACLVLHGSIAGVLAELPALVAGADGEGEASIALGAGARPVVDLDWRGDLAGTTFAVADAAIREGRWAGARVLVEGATRAAAFGDPRGLGTGADGEPLVFAPGGFSQTSSEGATHLARRVAELAATAERRVVELFAGSGTLSVLLARRAASFTAVEVDADASACARDNLAARHISGKVVAGDADAWAIPRATDVVVLDPPRTGARGASREIARSRAKTVVYVSCDPATLARDLETLAAARFSISDVETFELFPQTSHVETVVRLARP